MPMNNIILQQIRSSIEKNVDTLGIEIKEDNIMSIIDFTVMQLNNFPGSQKAIELSDDEKETIRKELESRFAIEHTHGVSIDNDGEEVRDWYSSMDKSHEIFWPKYRQFLIDQENYDIASVNLLGNTTLKELMDYLGDPRQDSKDKPLRRGLVIGDVQSGKTSTYAGLICKAADSGYRVVILLTGVTESLRRQTQERMEEGIIGMTIQTTINGKKKISTPKRVGVGNDNLEIRATALTSVTNDFKQNSDKIITSLSNFNLLMFIVKKNTTILRRMYNWLKDINADVVDHKIHFPMLLIDDEADNASINTKKDGNDPTITNKLIRQLCNIFNKSTYVGFTATPFANVFINPETTEEMENADLFPEDFMYVLPVPSTYIGAKKIYSENGPLRYCLRFINDIEEPSSEDIIEEIEKGEDINVRPLYYKHTKQWHGSFPKSLDDSLYAFFLANVIRDFRKQEDEARTMLINISRFVNVQQHTFEYVKDFYNNVYRTIKFDFSKYRSENEELILYKDLKRVWDVCYSNIEFDWNTISQKEILISAIENIEIVVVNGSNKTGGIDYKSNPHARIIAIGGLALSRGLTLKGLMTSYFYRNTKTFDVLMQMGRWFGYRPNYEDICRIWTSNETAEYYKEISDATEELKEDLERMNYLKQTPRDFGIKVRNDSDELQITAANKMRLSFNKEIFMDFWGNLFETPYLSGYKEPHFKNISAIKSFIQNINSAGYSFENTDKNGTNPLSSKIIRNIPKVFVTNILHNIVIYPQNRFDQKQLTDFIENNESPSLEKWDILFRSGNGCNYNLCNNICIRLVEREFSIEEKRLNIGNRGKLGGTNDGCIGINDDKIIAEAMKKYCHSYGDVYKKHYPSNTWFKFINIKERNPMLIIYLLDIKVPTEGHVEHLVNFKKELGGNPVVGIAIGFPENGISSGINHFYKVNKTYHIQDMEAALLDAEEGEEYE